MAGGHGCLREILGSGGTIGHAVRQRTGHIDNDDVGASKGDPYGGKHVPCRGPPRFRSYLTASPAEREWS